MAAERIDGLAGMILANPWVRRAETLNAAVVRHYYRERLVSAEFWRKLATGKLCGQLRPSSWNESPTSSCQAIELMAPRVVISSSACALGGNCLSAGFCC
jgi:hypothetical protein